MRVVIGGILHETSTFSIVPTTLEDFSRRWQELLEGERMLEFLKGTKTPVGGFLDAARDAAFEIVPTIYASAVPAGVVTAEAITVLTEKLVAGIKAALDSGPVDGLLLDLHGAMVSEIDDDGESYILRAVRAVVGPEMPVIVELDLHGNITQEMVDLATLCVAYDEYPHTDPYERAYEAGWLLARIVRGGVKPTPYLINIPVLPGMQRMYTWAEPMLSFKHLAHDIEGERGVLNVSYLPGFPYADIPYTSFSIIVTTDNNPAQAREAAERLARYIWERRDQYIVHAVPVDEAVKQAMAAPVGPVVLADSGDNPGAGTPADGTVMLEALLRLGAKRAAIAIIADPEAVDLALKAGEGAPISLSLGGKTDTFHGPPLQVSGRVVRITNGQFVHTGPMSTGA